MRGACKLRRKRITIGSPSTFSFVLPNYDPTQLEKLIIGSVFDYTPFTTEQRRRNFLRDDTKKKDITVATESHSKLRCEEQISVPTSKSTNKMNTKRSEKHGGRKKKTAQKPRRSLIIKKPLYSPSRAKSSVRGEHLVSGEK